VRELPVWRLVGLTGVSYAALTVVMTWPIAYRPSVPYKEIWADFGLWLWNLWWMKKALIELRIPPYFTSYLFHPTGTSLGLQNLSPYNGLVGIPLQLLGADVVTAYNLLYLSSFALAGVGMFLLVRELLGDTFASFLAGAVYAFSPFRANTYEFVNLWATQWIPFALLFLVRLARVGRRSDGLGLSVALMLASLADWQQPVFLLLAALTFALCAALNRNRTESMAEGWAHRWLWSALLYLVLIFPVAFFPIRELARGDIIHHTGTWGSGLGLLGPVHRGSHISYGVVLGWIPAVLAVYGIRRGLDFWVRGFAILLGVSFVLSLGEGLQIPGFPDPVFPLPFLLWRKIPLLGIVRGPLYFWIMVQVCFAVLVGHGAKTLWERIIALWRDKSWHHRLALRGGLVGLILVEAFQGPFMGRGAVRLHPVYEMIRHEDSREGILDAPLAFTLDTNFTYAGRSMFLQVYHGHPLVGGFLQFDLRSHLNFLEHHRVLRPFLDTPLPSGDGRGISPGEEEDLRAFLTKYRIRWIILHKSVRDAACVPPHITPAPALTRLRILVTPAVANRELRTVWDFANTCGYLGGDWDGRGAKKADALLRRYLGPPMWDDPELTAYRITWENRGVP
jgi:hypothetical protein